MIKILFLIEKLTGGGAEKVLRDLVNHMDQSRFDITVETVWPCDDAEYLTPGIRYRSMYAEESRLNHLRYRAEAAAGLSYRLYIKDSYDIECAYLEMGPTKVIAASTNRKSKKLAWVHCDLGRAVADPRAFAAKTAPWYGKFDEIVCVSQTVKEAFERMFGNCFCTTVMYNTVDDTAIREKARLPLPEGAEKRRLTVLSVGRMCAQKCFLRLLKAHKKLLEDGILHDLWILGDGPDRGELERYVSENRLHDSVYMPGFAENPYPFMRSADVLACSSVYEGFSTFVTEGMILGKPVVTTEVSGMRELLGNSEYGLVTENEDGAFYRGLKQMLEDPSLRQEFAAQAGKRGSDFSCEKTVRLTEDYFRLLIDAPGDAENTFSGGRQ